MVRMSRTRGMRCRVTGSSVSSAAASAGSAEFFEPLVGISPSSGVPPVMTNLSIECLSNPSARRGEPPLGLFAGQPRLRHQDRRAHAAARLSSSSAARS